MAYATLRRMFGKDDAITTKPHVTLPAFSGPLDLLLHVIERDQLDITTISLAQVADQYMAAVHALDMPDPNVLAEFLVIGARLLVIKTRALLPRPPVELAPSDEDPGEQLARQLQEYRRFKAAAAQLRVWEGEGRRSFARTAPPPVPPVPPVVPAPLDIDLQDLVALVERRLALIAAQPAAVPLPVPKIVTIADVRAHIYEVLATQHWFSFEDLLSFSLTRNEVIVTLWTVLELFKRQVITFEQQGMFGTITIGRGALFGGREVWNDEGDTERG